MNFLKEKENVLILLSQNNIDSIIETELSEDSLNHYKLQIDKFKNDNLFVAVLGRQGVGKSTLLNALLFDKKILPIDVMETNNVLTKIYSNENEYVEVFFDNNKLKGEFSTSFLKQYIDERFNKGNEKRVLEVRCYTTKINMPKGIAFVDTPGVGSLIAKNGKITFDFLPSITVGIFLFSTTPALLDTETNFLKATLNHINHYFFVQNVWGEDLGNINLSKQYNKERVEEIAKEFKYQKFINIFDVDVDSALQGICNKDIPKINTSKIIPLKEAILKYLSGEPSRIQILEFITLTFSILDKVQSQLLIRKINLTEGINKTDQEFDEAMNKTREEILDAEHNWGRLKVKFFSDISKLIIESNDDLDSIVTEIIEYMFKQINESKMNSDKIKETFEIKVEVSIKNLTNTYSRKYSDLVQQFIEDFNKINLDVNTSTYRNLDLGQHFRNAKGNEVGETVGKVLKYFGNIGTSVIIGDIIITGSLAVIEAGSLAAGLTAAAGAASAVPVWGWITAGALLVVGGTVKHFYGKKAKEDLKNSIKESLKNIKNNMRSNLKQSVDDNSKNISERLDKELKDNIDNIKKMQEHMKVDRFSSELEREKKLQDIENKLKMINDFINIMKLKSSFIMGESSEQ